VNTFAEPASPLTPSGNLARRSAVNRLFEASASAAALLAIGVLGILVYSVASRGADALSISFLTQDPPQALLGLSGGGIRSAIIGTALMVAVATAIAMPIGVLVALYLTEFATPRSGRIIRLALDLLNGLPSIVIALFVFELLVVGTGQRGFFASFALAIIMLPLIARASQEVLLLVPESLREAADALGVTRWRAVRGVLLPAAMGGIVTATLLAVSRAAGETAPVLVLTSIYSGALTFNIFGQAVPNIPVFIFQGSEQSDPSGLTRAWGAALVLLLFILLLSVSARALLARSRAKLTQ
jgi:phosphate transport system permease protein